MSALLVIHVFFFFFFKQKTAYEMRISDWSSDGCSSDLGLGADGNDFVPIVKELDLSGCPGIRFVFPHAPQLEVTINGGRLMPAWFDIESTEFGRDDEDRKSVV